MFFKDNSPWLTNSSGYKKYLEKVQKRFPEFFNEKNPKPIMLKFHDKASFRAKMDGHVVQRFPEEIPIRPYVTITINHSKTKIQYYDQHIQGATPDKDRFRPDVINLTNKFHLRPGRDTDLLVFLWCFSDQIMNNGFEGAASEKRGDSRVMFDLPKDTAKATQRVILEKSKLQVFIMDPVDGLSDEMVPNFALASGASDDIGEDVTVLREKILNFTFATKSNTALVNELKANSDVFKDRLMFAQAVKKRVIMFNPQHSSWHWVIDDSGAQGQRICVVPGTVNKYSHLARFYKEEADFKSQFDAAMKEPEIQE